MYCISLTGIPPGLFDNNPNVTEIDELFSGCTSITSAVPELWNMYPAATHGFTFRNVTNASNYSSIPLDWY